MTLPPLGPALGVALAIAGWAVVHFLWQGAVLGLTVEAMLRALRGASPRARERVAWLGLITMVLVFTATGVRAGRQAIEGGIVMTMEAEQDASDPVRAEEASRDIASRRRALGLAPAPAAPDPVTIAAPAIGVLWLAFAELLTLGLVRGWWQTRRVRSLGARPAGAELERSARALALRMGIRGQVRLLASSAVDVPAVAGWLSPAVLLPERALHELPHEALESVIAHELAHVRRGDAMLRVLQRALRAVLFFHPSAHRLLAVVDRERERGCDDLAVAACGSPVLYARALARLERLRSRVPELAMAADGAPLLARVRRLLEPGPPLSPARTAMISAAAGAAALVIAAAAVTAAPTGNLAPKARAAIAALRAHHVAAHAFGPDDRLTLQLKDVRRIRTPHHDPRAGP